MSQRTERLDELLRQEIGAMLEREIADPRLGFATVTQVETDPDLRHARVWVSVIGGSDERSKTLVALEHAMVFIRRELGTRLRLKRIPDLHVRLDDSIERAGTFVRRRVEAGDENFVRMLAEMGGMERYERQRKWWHASRSSFAAALDP